MSMIKSRQLMLAVAAPPLRAAHWHPATAKRRSSAPVPAWMAPILHVQQLRGRESRVS